MRLTLDGGKLRERRRHMAESTGKPKQWSVEAVAYRASVSEKTIRNMETGRHRSNPAQADCIFRGYRVPADERADHILPQQRAYLR